MSDEKKYEKFKEVMRQYQISYQEEFKDSTLIKQNEKAFSDLEDFYEWFENTLEEAQDLGFVQGMKFATEMMSATEKEVKHKELMDMLLKLAQK